MLREHGRNLQRLWTAVDAAMVLAVFGALLLSPPLRGPEATAQLGLWPVAGLGLALVIGWPMLMSRFGVYQSQRRESIPHMLSQLAWADGLGALVFSTAAFVLSLPLAPIFPLVFALTLFSVQAAFRIPTFFALHALRRSGHNYRNVILIGAGPRAKETKRVIEAHPEWGLRILGFLDDGDTNFVPSVPASQVYKFIDLPDLLREQVIDEAIVACPRAMLDSLTSVVRECALIGVPVTLLTDLFGEELPPPRVGRFSSMATLSFAPVHHNEIGLSVKRAIDIAGALAGLAISGPAILAAAIAIRLSSPGPIFFWQTRCGVYGRSFKMPKLRTMYVDAEARKQELMHLNEMDGPVFKMKDDPRITPVGRYLRKWSIDELPQFWSVLTGEMSLVGPRPPTPDEVGQYRGSNRRRLSMRPGITCLWQVSGRNEISFEEWMELDLEYIDSWSLGSDLRILARTIPQVLLAKGAS